MKDLTRIFKMLSDETRLRIVLLLTQVDRLCVCELCGAMDLSQPQVSKHLAKLRDLSVVSAERSEQFIYYSLQIEDAAIMNMLKK